MWVGPSVGGTPYKLTYLLVPTYLFVLEGLSLKSQVDIFLMCGSHSLDVYLMCGRTLSRYVGM